MPVTAVKNEMERPSSDTAVLTPANTYDFADKLFRISKIADAEQNPSIASRGYGPGEVGAIGDKGQVAETGQDGQTLEQSGG